MSPVNDSLTSRAMLCAALLLLPAGANSVVHAASAEIIEPTDPTPAPPPPVPIAPPATATPTAPKATDPAGTTDTAGPQLTEAPPENPPVQPTTPPLEPPKSTQAVTRMPITVNEPDFKATAVFPVTPVPKLDQDTRPVKEVAKPKHREFIVPQEDGVSETTVPVDDKGDASKKDAEEISPLLANAIAKERSGKKFKDILPLFQQVVTAEPENAEAHYRLGLLMHKSGDLKTGIQELEAALKLRPNNNKYRCDFGLLVLQAGWVEKALSSCRAAAQAAPAVARYQSALGDVVIAAGDLQSAVEVYTRAVSLEPKNAEYLHNLGKAFLLGRAYKRAGEVIDEAIHLRPDYAPYYCSRGLVFQSDKGMKDAIRSYLIAIKLDKDNAYAHYLLAGCYSDADDPTYTNRFEAFDHAEKAVKLTEGKNPQYLMGLARVYRLQRNWDGAISTASHAIEIQPREDWRQELAEFQRLRNEGHEK